MWGKKFSQVLCVGVLCFSVSQVAGAAAYIPFRQRHPQLVVPKYEEPKVILKEDGPKLIFSDSPEMVTDCGIMYKDTVTGKVRLFFHHVNATPSEKRLAVVLRNPSFRSVNVTLGAKGISKARGEEGWLLAGKEAQEAYFKSQESAHSLTVKRYVELLTDDRGRRFKPNELITGIVDLETTRPLEIAFYLLPVRTEFRLALDMYKPLPADKGGHVLRGTFPTSNVHVTLPEPFDTEGNAIYGINLADNTVNPYVRGIDALTGKPVLNYGNYGVLYDFVFKTKGKGEVAVNFSPEGGIYAGFGKFGQLGASKLLPIPRGKVYFGARGAEETINLGTLPGGQTGEVIFSPPGSSNLPIKILLIPEKRQK